MPITIASFQKVNAAMAEISQAYAALQLPKVTIQETGQQFTPPQALRDLWQQAISDSVSLIKTETAGW